MGIYSRDYIRDDAPGGGWEARTSGLSVVTWMIIVTGGLYLLQVLAGPQLMYWLFLRPEELLRGQVWRLLTYAFIHDPISPWHLLFNMYILYLTGRDLEQRKGPREFVTFYLLAAVVSGAAFIAWALFLERAGPAYGASGAVCAVMMVYAFTYPNQVWRIWGIFPVKVIWIAAATILFDSLPMLRQLVQRDYSDMVAHSAHLGGIAFGILYQKNGWTLTGWWPRTRGGKLRNPFRRGPKLKVHRPAPTDSRFDDRVDALLDKVAKQGEASLTADEREVLIEASRRARERLPR